MKTPNLLDNIPEDLPEEIIETLAGNHQVRIERIVSQGHASPPDFWYDQDTTEFVLLLQGQARLTFRDHTVDLNPGDYLTINAHQKHRVTWTDPDQPTVWLAVHYQKAAPCTTP
ncbi:MAG: cupin domain-containing protein [Phycisphaerae bacterium]|nr:cupin domain-containing protein [Phycisphaerae bacterium]